MPIVPVLVIGGLMIAGAVAGGAAAASGKNKSTYKPNKEGPNLGNDYRKQADQMGDDRELMGRGAQGRQGVMLDNTLADGSRGQQQEALSEIRKAALGEQPSVAQLQMKAGLDQTLRNQAAMASAARGQAGLAMAQQNAQVNNSMASQNVAAQQSVLRAQEMSDARNAWMGGSTQIRGLDENRSATQASLEAQQRGLNDQFQLGMYGQAVGLHGQSMEDQRQQRAQELAKWQYQDSMDRKLSDDERAKRQQDFNDVVGGASAGASMGASMMSYGAAGSGGKK